MQAIFLRQRVGNVPNQAFHAANERRQVAGDEQGGVLGVMFHIVLTALFCG